jgi:CRP-like cAMP-binding protein
MRQVFLQSPWIYHKEPQEIIEIFFRYGVFERLKKGTPLKNGGASGRFYYLKKGLATFTSQDRNGRNFSFCLVIPGRVLADIDGISRENVNVVDKVIRPSEVLSIDYDTWYKHIGSDPDKLLMVTRGIIAKHESHMEAMIANYTLSIEDRLKVFLKTLLKAYENPLAEWNWLPLYLSEEEYSGLLGASRVSISRQFIKWRELGLLRKEKREIIINKAVFDDVYDWTDS